MCRYGSFRNSLLNLVLDEQGTCRAISGKVNDPLSIFDLWDLIPKGFAWMVCRRACSADYGGIARAMRLPGVEWCVSL